MTNRRMIFAGLGLILLIAATIGMAQELADPTPGSSGTSYGTVREITKEYIRVESPGDIGRRYYFSWVEKPGATTKPAPDAKSKLAADWEDAAYESGPDADANDDDDDDVPEAPAASGDDEVSVVDSALDDDAGSAQQYNAALLGTVAALEVTFVFVLRA